MSMIIGQDQGKSAFAKKVLLEEEHANAARINELWAEDGHEGTISISLVNKMRSEMGLTGNLRRGPKKHGKKPGRKPKAAGVGLASATPSAYRGRNARVNRLADVEADIDRLLFKVMAFEELDEVADSLRQARRLVSRALV